jgi:hypothetical protein
MMKKSISHLLAAFATLAVTVITTPYSQAQGYYYPEVSNYGYQSGYRSDGNLGQYVFALDQYGDQMSYLYSMEARNYCGCSNAAALLSEMRRYNSCTNSLVAAYQGSCSRTFQRAACGVRESLNRVEALRNRARVSPQVCALITQSCPLATYVHNNSRSFAPVVIPQVPVYHPAPVYHQSYSRHSGCPTPAPVVIQHSRHSCNNGRGLDVGSAIFGAVAGRVIHGIIHNH